MREDSTGPLRGGVAVPQSELIVVPLKEVDKVTLRGADTVILSTANTATLKGANTVGLRKTISVPLREPVTVPLRRDSSTAFLGRGSDVVCLKIARVTQTRLLGTTHKILQSRASLEA